MPSSWQAALPHGGSTRSLLDWWQGFNDPTLNDLLQAAESDNPTLTKAAAAIASAKANRSVAAASAYPVVFTYVDDVLVCLRRHAKASIDSETEKVPA